MYHQEENFSDYIVYVDESGDHELTALNKNYPVFVLAFCVFAKDIYSNTVSTAIQKLKFKHFGHDMIVLHEQKIRKAIDHFGFLTNADRRNIFMTDLNQFMQDAPFTLIASAIRKEELKRKYIKPSNPYHLALCFGLERIFSFLYEERCHEKTLHIVCECRGKKEDKELELEFKRICDGNNKWQQRLPFKLVFADKKTNSCGLQLADLIARPIGRYILNAAQENRAYDILKEKFYRPKKIMEGYGLECFP